MFNLFSVRYINAMIVNIMELDVTVKQVRGLPL